MKYNFLCFLMIILISSCSSTILIKKNDASLEELNKELEDEEVTIKLLNGDEITAVNVIVLEDSIYFEREKSDSNHFVPTEKRTVPIWKINKISYSNNTKGVEDWMGLGLLIGTSAGLLTAWDMCKGGGMIPEGYGIAIGGVAGFLSGLVLGPPFGAVIGHQETYIFSEAVTSSEKYVTIEIEEILEEKKKSIILNWKDKIIYLPKSKIVERIAIDNRTYFRIDELSYNKYFLDKPVKSDNNNKINSTEVPQIKKKNRLIQLTQNKIINDSEKAITILWGFKKIKISKSDILDINKNNYEITIKMTGENYERYFKQKR